MADVDLELQHDLSSLEQKMWDSATLAPEQASRHALVFSIAEQNFAIAADFIEQIVELPKFTDVPSAGSTLLGLADHAGQPIPVVDIAPLLNIESGTDIFRHGLLLNHKGLKVMLAIETVVVLRELSKERGCAPPPRYQATGFVEYACELAIVDGLPDATEVSRAGSPDNARDSAAEKSGKESRKPVVVLNVSQLLKAVHSAATTRPVV